MERAAADCGLLPWEAEELTFGELKTRLQAVGDRERRRAQNAAVVAYHQMGLLAQVLAGVKSPELYEAFPLWDEADIRDMKVEKYRRVMERYAAAGRGGDKHGQSHRTADSG